MSSSFQRGPFKKVVVSTCFSLNNQIHLFLCKFWGKAVQLCRGDRYCNTGKLIFWNKCFMRKTCHSVFVLVAI